MHFTLEVLGSQPGAGVKCDSKWEEKDGVLQRDITVIVLPDIVAHYTTTHIPNSGQCVGILPSV